MKDSIFTKYITSKRFKRIIVLLFTIWAVTTINFIIPRLMPGDPISVALSTMASQGAQFEGADAIIEAYKIKFGLNGSMFDQYIAYIINLLQGDLGVSILAFPTPVSVLISRAVPWTVGLLFTTTIISWLLGNLTGLMIGWRRGTKFDTIVTNFNLILGQIPYYFFALALVWLFVFRIPLFPSYGGHDINLPPGLSMPYILSVLEHAILPALTLVGVGGAGWMVSMRSMTLTVLGEDYLEMAEAKGLNENTILRKYVFRNAMLPQITGLAMALGFIMNGALLMETLFAYPGMGTLFIVSLGMMDYITMSGVFLMTTLTVLLANFLIEMIYPFFDPRAR